MIGILQGRLTPPWNGKLQCFPKDAWEPEFESARRCGFDALEPFVEVDHNPANPMWTEEGRARLRALSASTKVALSTLCADCFMGTPFLQDPETSVRLLNQLAGFGYRTIVLPFFEKAEIRTTDDASKLAAILKGVDPRGATLALETTLPASELLPLIDRTGLAVCYDLGNTTALGHDVPGDIRKLGGRIRHVHVKDKRRSDGSNVLLGTGDADLPGAFRALREIGYAGDYTLETFRGEDPLATARRHRELVEGFLR